LPILPQKTGEAMPCAKCGMNHTEKYHVKNKLTDKGFPTHDKGYKSAHEEVTKKEKAKFPSKDYKKLKAMDESLPSHELIGKNTKRGEIEVSKKVPSKLRNEVAFHERVENKILRKK
jgi:hypothetical protein